MTNISEKNTANMQHLRFWEMLHRMLRVIQRFGEHFSCHLQGEYVLIGRFWQPYVVQGVDEALDVMELSSCLSSAKCSSPTGYQPDLLLQ
jgi:hypothetical protein